MEIRPATTDDAPAIWAIISPVIQKGETYALPRDMSEPDALAYWLGTDRETFIAHENGTPLGTYYLRANQQGGGAHVANCGYITGQNAQGKGVARAMCTHSLATARARGFKAMQFNLVISTNERAVKLWRTLGFTEIGRLPNAFNHPTQGYVDALIFHQPL
jgi:L-amino acid N-acyltransferase YncA